MPTACARELCYIKWEDSQKTIVSLINQVGGQAVGLTGKDAGLIEAHKKLIANPDKPEELLDLGLVGEVTEFNLNIIYNLLDNDFIPVISPIGFNSLEEETYNINADLVAGKLAEALQAEKLLLMSNIPGVLDKSGQVLRFLSGDDIAKLIEDETITGGMLPKVASALEAAQNGVGAVHIVDGRVPHCLLLEMLTYQGAGTVINA